ncbi:polysaccharide biosynthesis/export family protein [Pseudomonas sp. PDNC002]|uniref:polysaccharide biosynthesis/export family protein n=1 Tax=Pseudomonas sp. PDNC002 TaxID=2811422 RepID=UPI001965A9DC|nr:polysaccharide biosynthesis/export family protein [Pseudomonas sp. PDNC002]QRY80246.1 polysaccharide biosynthesis/export family protein [Pseudomonas sp. PDNC002]
MKNLLAFSLVVGSLALQGCVFSPGQHMTDSDIQREAQKEGMNITLVPITPQVLQRQEADFAARPGIPTELTNYRPPQEDYVIGGGDVLLVTVWDHPELTSPGSTQQMEANGRVVGADGNIFFPYAGVVRAEGQTPAQLRKRLSSQLAKKGIVDPQVDVTVLRYSSQHVVLSGAFQNGGQVELNNTPTTLVQAVSKAGVIAGEADLSGLTLKRDGREYVIDVDALNRTGSTLSGIYLKNGDQIHLPYNDRKKVYVVGEVERPQVVTYRTTGLSLLEVLGNAGGLSPETSDGDSVYVIRGAPQQTASSGQKGVFQAQVFHLEAKRPTAYALAKDFAMQPQDVVFIGPANITRWNRFISQLLPSASFVGTGAALGR